MSPCFLYFPVLKCFSPTAGHTVVETLCLRRDSGTDLTEYVALRAHWFTQMSSVFPVVLHHSIITQWAHAWNSSFYFSTCRVLFLWRGMSSRAVTMSSLDSGVNFLLASLCPFLLFTAENQSMFMLLSSSSCLKFWFLICLRGKKKIKIQINLTFYLCPCSLQPFLWLSVGMGHPHSCEAMRRAVIGCAPTPPAGCRSQPVTLHSPLGPAWPRHQALASTLDSLVCHTH